MLPTYNPDRHLFEALESIISQYPDSGNMQIEVVDDCSPDVDVEKLVKEFGNSRIKFYRNPVNLGHSFNFTECIRRANGELIHLLHEDDLVKPGFYKKFEEIFDKYKTIGAAYCRQEYIDEDGGTMFFSDTDLPETGIMEDAVILLAERQRIQYCSMVVKRSAYEKTGGFMMKNIGCEDWEMWVRIAANFPVAYTTEALAKYRIHRSSMTGGDMRTGRDMRDLRESAEIFTEYLPKEKRKEVALKRNLHYGSYSFENAKKMLNEFKDEEGAAAQLSETIKLNPEIVFNNLDFLKQFTIPVESAGVSVIVVTKNNESLVDGTLQSLLKQEVYDYIPWEIIIADAGSSDNTLKIATDKLLKSGDKVTYRIIETGQKEYFDIYKTAFENSKYDTVVFCNPGELLNSNYISRTSEIMLKYGNAGVIGGYSEFRTNITPPGWFDNKIKKLYQTGEQYEYTSDITWSKGYVWGSGMVLRKEAWESLIKKNFDPYFAGSINKISKTSFEKELCYALRSAGWNLIYKIDLTLTKFIPEEELRWDYLKKIIRQKGIESVVLSSYKNLIRNEAEDFSAVKKPVNIRKSIIQNYRMLKKFKFWKLKSYKESLAGDRDIPEIEFYVSRLRELTKLYGNYNKNLRLLKKTGNKKYLGFLKHIFGNSYFRFPHYKLSNNRNGISIVLNYNNTSTDLLYRSLFKIYDQKLPADFPYEVILCCKSMSQDLRTEVNKFCQRIGPGTGITIFENNSGVSYLLLKQITRSCRYDNLLFLSELTFINSDFLGSAYKVLNTKKEYSLITGELELTSDVKPPKWFVSCKEYFGEVNYPDRQEDITDNFCSIGYEGVIVRKDAALKFFSGEDFLNENTDYKIQVDSNGDTLRERINTPELKILFAPQLKYKKFISVKYFSPEYFSKLNQQSSGKPLTDAAKVEPEVSGIKTLQKKLKGIFISKDNGNGHSKNGKAVKNELSIIHSGRNGNAVTDKKVLNKGVSVVICCYNSSKVLPKTLKYLLNQKVPDTIPWEILIINNASTDNTSETAKEILESSFCKVPFTIVKEPEPGLSAARLKGLNTAKYGYIIFCDDDNRLQEDFVRISYETMESNKEIGVLGGQSIAEYEVLPKPWFKDWKNSFAIGKQGKNEGDITWTTGFVWGASMVVRKEAWESLVSKGFRSILTDRKGNTLSAGGDTEICYALRNEGWKIWYNPGLKFRHYISSGRLNWKYLRKLFRGFGNASAGLDEYRKKIPERLLKESGVKKPSSVRYELHKALKVLRKTRYKKLLSFKRRREGDTDIPMLEYTSGRIESLLKTKGSYNRGIKLLKKTARKNDFKYLSSVLGNGYSDFPRYRKVKKLNGVSVIICTYNGADRLTETIRHIANQKVNPDILWEVILVDNASTDNSKEVTQNEWNRHKCKAKLKIIDQPIPGKQLALEKGYEVAKYEYWLTCDDDNWLEENFVQLTYEIMSSNEKIGVLGGPNEALCELDPPEWFKWFQKDYAAGPQGDIYTGKVSEGNITWKRGFVWGAGMIVRKSAWEKLIADGFRTSMSCRKGTELSSGGDSEACYALVLAGWHVWYDNRLKLKHCMPAGRLDWNYLIRLFSGFGVATVGLELYEKAIKLGHADTDDEEIYKQDWKYEFKRAVKELRKYGLRKILSLRFSQDNKTEIPMLEFYLAKVKELWKDRKEYNAKFEEIKKATWKKSFSELKADHRKYLENENDYRYGWPWREETPPQISAEVKSYPKISILSPSFNSEGTIEKAILSVLRQGYPDFEHIVCDGGSKDGTVDILKKYPHLKWISEKDSGQSDAMNKAFDMSTGDIIAYLNVDDYFQRGAFFKIAEEFIKKPGTEMVVGNLFFEFSDHTFTRNAEIDYKKIMLPFKYMFPINPVSYFYRRNVQKEIGPFPLDNHFTMDYWFLLKAYQNHKLSKIEDYLGTFCMNGYNKTSNADNRKNTHIRVMYHCWHYDKKNLPYYMYNYYKFFYYDEKWYNLNRVGYKAKKILSRIVSVLTFKKNKYYNERIYEKARYRYCENKRVRALSLLFSGFLIYPKSVKQNSRLVLLTYSLFGHERTEKLKWFYFFLTTPPGLPLANKLHYFGNEFKADKKNLKGNTLLFLTYIISPKFLFKGDKKKTESIPAAKESSGSKLRYLNPVYLMKGFVNYFRYKRYREKSYDYFIKAGDRYYFHKNFKAVMYLMFAFFIYPLSITKRSRLNLLAYSALGDKYTDKIKFAYHLYKDNPEYTLAHKLDYYGNELRQEGQSFKGNSILMMAYILNPSYISKRKKITKSNIVFVSNFEIPKRKISKNPIQLLKDTGKALSNPGKYTYGFREKLRNFPGIIKYRMELAYYYFRYRKFKAQSKDLYSRAQDSFNNNRRFNTVRLLIPSFILYPLSLFNRNKWSLMINSIIGNSLMEKLRGKGN